MKFIYCQEIKHFFADPKSLRLFTKVNFPLILISGCSDLCGVREKMSFDDLHRIRDWADHPCRYENEQSSSQLILARNHLKVIQRKLYIRGFLHLFYLICYNFVSINGTYIVL